MAFLEFLAGAAGAGVVAAYGRAAAAWGCGVGLGAAAGVSGRLELFFLLLLEGSFEGVDGGRR